MTMMNLLGRSIIGCSPGRDGTETFNAVNPATGAPLEPAYSAAQAEDVDRAKRAAQEAVGMDPNISEEEMEEINDQLDAIPSQEDALREAFEESGLPEDLFEEFKAGWDEFMEGLRQQQSKSNLKIQPPPTK